MVNNLHMYCLSLNPRHLELIKELNYIPVGLGKLDFNNQWTNDIDIHNGDISHKNEYYGEYSFHYWFWKNQLDLESDNWIGFCQKRRFWIKLNSRDKHIINSNFNVHFLSEPHETWKNYESIICEEINVNNIKKIKFINKGYKNLLLDPSLFFDKSKQSIKLHFDIFHGYGNLDKAIDLFDNLEKEQKEKKVHV